MHIEMGIMSLEEKKDRLKTKWPEAESSLNRERQRSYQGFDPLLEQTAEQKNWEEVKRRSPVRHQRFIEVNLQ